MRRITVNGQLYALPFEKLFRPLTDAESKSLRTSIEQFWIQAPIITFISPTHGRAIIDGGNRSEIGTSIDAGKPIPTDSRGEMTDLAAESLAMTLNLDRRQLTMDEVIAFRQKQVALAKQLRHDGNSVRVIAEQTGLPKSTVSRLVETVPVGTVEPDDDDLFADADEEEYPLPPGRVVGRNGKSYPATNRQPEPADDEILRDLDVPTPKEAIFEKLSRLFDGIRREFTALKELDAPLAKREIQTLAKMRDEFTAMLKRKPAGKRA